MGEKGPKNSEKTPIALIAKNFTEMEEIVKELEKQSKNFSLTMNLGGRKRILVEWGENN